MIIVKPISKGGNRNSQRGCLYNVYSIFQYAHGIIYINYPKKGKIVSRDLYGIHIVLAAQLKDGIVFIS